ncbi:ATP-binding protein [Streptomyces sp. H27-D2]|uniref:ATP-binding protein n=1 Tax=Streptomyces sp. H27-D2 TaxID=3046304 RepID=UPI002DB611C3|nr:ATP-binding protein [Streptomyces sp. H27-D2]MEC4019911.1 ATP-binding protein [Streptomyces sp. H27-D2]
MGRQPARREGGDGHRLAPALSRRLRRSELASVAETRLALREVLRNWGDPGQSGVAELLATELATNALVHTDGDAVITATLLEGGDGRPAARLRVEVRDYVSWHPRPRVPEADGTTGRGLYFVQSLADAWGVRSHGTGKVVWFELDGGPA